MKNSRMKVIIISTVFLILTLPVAANFLIYLIEDLQFNFLLLNGIKITQFISVGTYKNFFNFKDVHVVNAFGWVIIVWNIISQLINNAEIIRRNKFEQNDEYGSHGTSRFQTKKEMKNNYAEDKLGWFLGSDKKNKVYELGMEALYHSVNSELNMQVTVVGPPGTNKTTGFIFPNIFNLVNEYKRQYKTLGEMPDLIITDPKPEIIYSTYNFLKENNYNIVIYDFIFFKYGDKINILDFIDKESEEEDLMNIADGYITSIEASTGGGGDGFWVEQEGQALAALLGAIKQNYAKPKIEDVYDLLDKFVNELDGSIDPVKANTYFKENVKGSALRLWKNFLLICKSENTAGNILGGLAGKLKLFSIKGIRNLTSESTFDIRQLGAKIGDKGKEKPTAIFIFMKAESRTYSPIINVVITTILNQLYSTSRFYNGRLYNPVILLLEEMANIGKISGIKEKLGTMRGARIYPMMIWQSLVQMKERYKDGWSDIISQCDTTVFLGFNEEFDAEYGSKALGNTTIKTQGISSKSMGYGIKDESESNNYNGRKLMFAEELRQMDRKEMIVIQGGKKPIHINKVQYKHWEEKHRICDKISQSDLPLLSNSINKDIENIKVKEYDNEIEKEHERENNKIHSNDINKLEDEKVNNREEIEEELEKEEEVNYFKKREKSIER